jgi:class 3 adenylate cyclase
MSDTSRMNKTMGLPPWQEAELNGSRIVRTKVLGQQQEWVESPWTWIVNQEIHQARIYKKGLMLKQAGVFRILSDKTSDDLHQVEVSFTWHGGPLLKFVIGPMSANFIKKAMTEYILNQERIYFADTQAQTVFLTPLRNLTAQDNDFIAMIVKDTQSQKPETLKTILSYLVASDSLDIHKINPKKLAKDIAAELHEVVEQLAILTEYGYLALTWDVICPHCRGPKVEATKLQLLTSSTVCQTCDVEFSTDTGPSIEVTFKPQSKFRKTESMTYCAAEPAKKAHILISWPTTDMVSKKVTLKPGAYRARTLHGKKECAFKIEDKQASSQQVNLDFKQPLITLAPGEIEITYSSNEQDYFVFESLAWSEEKYLVGEALSNVHIRHLVNDDLLKSGVKLNVGEQIILFTDIVGSTPMYKKLGDNKAFIAVHDHYIEIEKIIKANAGVVVKFIGDAVMAAFTDVSLALKANQEIHLAFKDHKNSLVLRTSFHIGHVLCVNLNVGLDYFGQTVNTAAKLQGWAEGFETAVSEQTLKRVPESQRSKLSIKRLGFDEKLQEHVLVF